MERTNLSNTHLEAAFLQRADMEGADFSCAHLNGASLKDADFRQAIYLGRDQVFSAASEGAGAILPTDWPADWRENQSDLRARIQLSV